MTPKDPITGIETPGAGPEQPVAGVGGATEAPVVAPQVPEDVDWQKREAELKQSFERDLGRMRSTYDSQIRDLKTDQVKQASAFEDQLHNIKMSSMDDAQKQVYELQLYRDRSKTLNEQLVTSQQELQNAQSMGVYMQNFLSLGVDPSKLDATNPYTLAETGWEATAFRIHQQDERLAELEKQLAAKGGSELVTTPAPMAPAPTRPGLPTAPAVVTQRSGEVPVKAATWSDLSKQLEAQYGQKFDVDKIYKWVEQGWLSHEILPFQTG